MNSNHNIQIILLPANSSKSFAKSDSLYVSAYIEKYPNSTENLFKITYIKNYKIALF